jgi:plasmid maintenance system antidote protein VapI
MASQHFIKSLPSKTASRSRKCPHSDRAVRPATLSDLINGNAASAAEISLRIENEFGIKMEALLNMQAWHDAYIMRRWEGEIEIKPYRPSTPERR